MKKRTAAKNKKVFFITGTDTDVGKTVVTAVLGKLLQAQGLKVGVMKPVQCCGHDAAYLKKMLDLDDPLLQINPCYAPEPLSPNVAFARKKRVVSVKKILQHFQALKEKYDILLVEGAGGVMVPIKKDFLMRDLIKEMDAEVLVVSRLGLGTINHTLLTVDQLRGRGLTVKGVIYNSQHKASRGIPEMTNPKIISQYGAVANLGTVGCLRDPHNLSAGIIKKKAHIDLKPLLRKECDSTRRLKAWDKKYVWHPFTQMQDWLEGDPLVIDRAEGCYLIDTQGNRYIDGISSLWVNVHGHRKQEVDQAIKDQISKVSHSTLLGLANTPSIELAKRLVEIAPKGLEKVFYSDSGSTSVEIAIKIAYQYWQNTGKTKKTKLVHLANSYHGDTLGSVSVGGIDLFHKVYQKLIIPTIQLEFPDCYRAPKGKGYPDYAFESVERFERLLKKQQERIAAFVVEPIVQGAAGMIMWPPGILKQMERLCRKYDVIFIVDEVATGFGRTGKMFACEHEKVRPDILCTAKGLTAGYLPLAATLTTNKIYQGFLFDYRDQKTFFHGHTYTGNPLCCAAALANLDVFQKEKVLKKLQPKIAYLKKELEKVKDLSIVGDVRQRGFMVGIELVQDKITKEAFDWEKAVGVEICRRLCPRGILLRPLGNVIVLMPPLSISKKELKKITDETYNVIKEFIQEFEK